MNVPIPSLTSSSPENPLDHDLPQISDHIPWSSTTKHCLICHVEFMGGGGGEGEGHGLILIHKLFQLEGEVILDSSTHLDVMTSSTSFLDSTDAYCISCSFKVGILVGLWKDLEGLQGRIHGIRLEFLQLISRSIQQVPPGPTTDLKLKVLLKAEWEEWRLGDPIKDLPVFQSSHSLDQAQSMTFQLSNQSQYSQPDRPEYPPVFSRELSTCEEEGGTRPHPDPDDPGVFKSNNQEVEDSEVVELDPSTPTSSSRKSLTSESALDEEPWTLTELVVPGSMEGVPSDDGAHSHSFSVVEHEGVRRSQRIRKPKVNANPGEWTRPQHDPEIGNKVKQGKRGSKVEGQEEEQPGNDLEFTPHLQETKESPESRPVDNSNLLVSNQVQGSPNPPTVKEKETEEEEKPKRIYKCKFCGKIVKSGFYLKTHTMIHTGEKPFKCGICPKTFRADNAKKKHEAAVHMISKTIHKCQHCTFTTGFSRNFKTHLELTHNLKSDIPQHPRSQCEVCGGTFTHKALLQHRRMYCGAGGEKEIPCKICGKPVQTKRMIWHRKTHNPPRGLDLVYKCTECPDGVCFSTVERLKRHLRECHGKKPKDIVNLVPVLEKLLKKYFCDVCPGLFYNGQSKLNRHIGRKHAVAYKYKNRTNMEKVPGRLKGFQRRTKVNPSSSGGEGEGDSPLTTNDPDMDSKVDDQDEFPCPDKGCPRSFKVLSTVKRHFIVHHPDSELEKTVYNGVEVVLKHLCQECAGTPAFETPYELLKHCEMAHSGEESFLGKPAICPEAECSAEFMFLWDLRTHFHSEHPGSEVQTLEIEGKDHPILFRCLQCPETDTPVFTGIAGLRVHTGKVHMSEEAVPELQCPACDIPPLTHLKDLQAHFSQTHKSASDKAWIEVNGHPLPLQIICPNCPLHPGFPSMTKLAEHMTFGQHITRIPGAFNPGLKCPECDESRTLMSLIRHFPIHHPTSTNDVVEFQGRRFSLFHRCLDCSLPPFKTEPLLEKHKHMCHMTGPGFSCTKCPNHPWVFKSRFHYHRHLNSFHFTLREKDKKNESAVYIEHMKKLESKLRDRTKTKRGKKRPHRPPGHDKSKSTSKLTPIPKPPLICPEADSCGSMTFRTLTDLRIHFREQHPTSDNFWIGTGERRTQLVYKCSHCPDFKPQLKLSDFQRHTHFVHGKKSKGHGSPEQELSSESDESDESFSMDSSSESEEEFGKKMKGPDVKEQSSIEIQGMRPWTLRQRKKTNYSSLLEGELDEDEENSQTPSDTMTQEETVKSSTSPIKATIESLEPSTDFESMPLSLEDIDIKYETLHFREDELNPHTHPLSFIVPDPDQSQVPLYPIPLPIPIPGTLKIEPNDEEHPLHPPDLQPPESVSNDDPRPKSLESPGIRKERRSARKRKRVTTPKRSKVIRKPVIPKTKPSNPSSRPRASRSTDSLPSGVVGSQRVLVISLERLSAETVRQWTSPSAPTPPTTFSPLCL